MKKVILIVYSVILIAGLFIGCDTGAVSEVFNPNSFIVSFVSFETDGASTITSQTVLSGEKATEPTVPSKIGQDFDKWYSDAELTKKFNFNTPITENITLYAKWDFATYDIIYRNSDGLPFDGDFDKPYPTTHTYGSETNLVLPISPTNFNGWYLDKECTTSITNIDSTFDTSESYITLYAGVKDGCLAAGTLITMADGTKQKVETLKIGDMIRTVDHETGRVSSAPIYSFWAIEGCYGNFILNFEGGVSVSVVQEHCFFAQETNKYEIISYNNANEYIGYSFYSADNAKWLKLLSVEFREEPVTAYYVFTAKHYNHFAEGMLSLDTLDEKSFMYAFDFGENLKFDEVKKDADILQYGLMTIEEMPYVPQDYFDAFNMQYLKIAYGKGLANRQHVEELIHYYLSQAL